MKFTLLLILLCASPLAGCAGAIPSAEPGAAQEFNESARYFTLAPEVRICIDAPAGTNFDAGRKTRLIFYALPNGSSIEQTMGRRTRAGGDWHFDIQHIAAQTRFLRRMMPDWNIVVAYLESEAKPISRSWPLWRKKHGNGPIPGILADVESRVAHKPDEIVLASHSGGGSLVFGYLNAIEKIPDNVTRIAFLDSDYAYDPASGHEKKLAQWLAASSAHYLCVLAYDDYAALLDGKHFVSEHGGAWGRSHAMVKDLSADFALSHQTNGVLETVAGLSGRITFLLMDNPQKKILHTVQVEKNGFIEAMVSGTANEGKGFRYFGPRAYAQWIGDK